MMQKIPAVLVGVILAGAVAFGQGAIIPRPFPTPLPRPVPYPIPLKVKSVRFATTITGNVAETRVTQVFSNEYDWVVEGDYFFPLPNDATFSEFAVYDGDKRMKAEVLEKEKARQIYNAIVHRYRDPGLLEYVGQNLFQAHIYPVPARGEKKIELAYSQILKAESGMVSYRYPLSSGTRANPHPIQSVSGTVTIKSPLGLKNIYSPSHGVDIHWSGEQQAKVGFETFHTLPTQDFLLYYLISNKEFGLSLMTYREANEDGYYLLLISPKLNLRKQDIQAKDIIFVLDTSGSMSEDNKIEQAKQALKFGLRRLHAGDSFNLITFATEVHLFKNQLQTASKDNVEAAVKFVDQIAAMGGTNIYEALTDAIKQFKANRRPHYLVFLTDGQPTVGPSDTGQILKAVKEGNQSSVRVFSFGVGYDVSTRLLDRLSEENGGVSDYVVPKENLEVKVSTFFEKVNSPVLSDVAFDSGNLVMRDNYPRRAPDLFKGSQLSVLGRYNSHGHFPLAVIGKMNGETRRFVYETGFPAVNSENDFLPRLWAMRKVTYLLEQIRLNGENAELKNEVLALAKKNGFVTPYTSFLAVEDAPLGLQPRSNLERPRPHTGYPMTGTAQSMEAVTDALGQRVYGRGDGVVGGVAGGVVGGVLGGVGRGAGGGTGTGSGFGPTGGPGHSPKDRDARLTLPTQPAVPYFEGTAAGDVGESAVRTSQALHRLKESAQTLPPTSPQTVREVGSKTFILKDNVWDDTAIGEKTQAAVLKIKYGGEEYFSLVAKALDLAKFLALGKQVKVLYKDRIYEIVE
ncbi:MAG: VWA domain-containing protein [Acidobacteria bacterium]|nr:VWA domain-containing protein [Acidobacteriota bacterium]MBI3656178.1 VWA domain-containing protein [Acidobacteriota bacterium]